MLLEQLQEEYITALKTKDRIKKEILSYVIAQIKNKQIDLRETLNDDEIIKVIKKEIKSRQEALGFLEQSQDTAGVHEEKAKMQILQTYLPVQLTEEQLRNIVQEQVALLGITDLQKQKGQLIGTVMQKYGGQVEGALLTAVIASLTL